MGSGCSRPASPSKRKEESEPLPTTRLRRGGARALSGARTASYPSETSVRFAVGGARSGPPRNNPALAAAEAFPSVHLVDSSSQQCPEVLIREGRAWLGRNARRPPCTYARRRQRVCGPEFCHVAQRPDTLPVTRKRTHTPVTFREQVRLDERYDSAMAPASRARAVTIFCTSPPLSIPHSRRAGGAPPGLRVQP